MPRFRRRDLRWFRSAFFLSSAFRPADFPPPGPFYDFCLP
jgi:hypothetical protein